MDKKRRTPTAFGFGATTIFSIFILLSIITFSVLSLVSARADMALSTQEYEHVANYYNAENRAEARLSDIDKVLWTMDKELSTEKLTATLQHDNACTVTKQEGKIYLSYKEDISSTQCLAVSIELLSHSDKERYRIVQWQTINTLDWQPQENFNLLQ